MPNPNINYTTYIIHWRISHAKMQESSFFVQKIGFEILDKKEDFTNDR